MPEEKLVGYATKSYQVTFTPRSLWVLQQMRAWAETSNGLITDDDLLRQPLQIYAAALLNYADRNYLFFSKQGKRAHPLNLENVGDLLELPPESGHGSEITKTILLGAIAARHLDIALAHLKTTEASGAVLNAIFFAYDLVKRASLPGGQIFLRNAETSKLDLVHSPHRGKPDPNPAA